MKKHVVICGLLCLVALMSFRSGRYAFFHKPEGWPDPVYNFRKHPLRAGKIALGRALFYDPILSADSTISCTSCHLQATSFTHVDHQLSHGVLGKMGNRNAPGLVNLAWSNLLMWDGSADNVDVQAFKPITNPLEMDETMDHVVQKLQRSPKYRAMAYDAYGDSGITSGDVAGALSQFLLTMVSANAKYDRVQRGEEKFNEPEERGYALFRKNCSVCHTEPLFTNGGFENNGLMVDDSLRDMGRMKITHNSGDSLKFKVPTLRNIEYTYPYMHDGRFKTLNMVLNNYIMGIEQSPTLNPVLKKGIFLTSGQKADLVAFLLTLSDKEFLKDPRFGYPGK